MISRRSTAHLGGALLVPVLALVAQPAAGQVQFLGPGSFTPLAPAITFSEYALGTVNPSYNFLGVPGLGDVSVNFGGHFIGQSTTVLSGGAVSLTGSPTGPIALDPGAPETYIEVDGAHPTTPVLSGTPQYDGPISMLFGTPVAAVGLNGGFFNAVNSTFIEAFDAAGNSLGAVTNSQEGIEFFGVVTQSGANQIAGISFYITELEPAGFTIDNVTFGGRGQLVDPPGEVVPEPATIVLLATGLMGLGVVARRRRKLDLEA